MIPKDEYDPAVHVTAAELRASGIPVPDNIPDVGFVRRGSIIPTASVVDVTADDTTAGRMRVTLRFDFTEPFQWIEVDVVPPAATIQPCLTCNGDGTVPGAFLPHVRHECETCNGTGTTPDEVDAVADFVECPECNGTGRLPRPEDHELSGERPAEIERATIEALPCLTCNGTGRVDA